MTQEFIGLNPYPYTDELSWRPLNIQDAQAITDLYELMDATDETNWGGPLEYTLQDFKEPGFNPEKDTLAAIRATGEIAALGWVFPPRNSEQDHWLMLWGVVHPEYRRRGLGGYLMDWLEKRGTEVLETIPDSLPRRLRVPTPDYMGDRIAIYENHKFQLVRSGYRMRRSLLNPIPEPVIPEGLRLVGWQAHLSNKIRNALDEAFRDHWGHADWTDHQWEEGVINSSTFRPEYSYLILDGDEVAGGSINRVLNYENERTGLKEGWIASLGVRQPYRKQDLGTALLSASMRTFQADGYTHAGLGVDTQNLICLHQFRNLVEQGRPDIMPTHWSRWLRQSSIPPLQRKR